LFKETTKASDGVGNLLLTDLNQLWHWINNYCPTPHWRDGHLEMKILF